MKHPSIFGGAVRSRYGRNQLSIEGRPLGMITPSEPTGEPSNPEGGRHDVTPPGALRTLCWCQRGIVYVASADVLRGVTGRCGRRACAPPKTR